MKFLFVMTTSSNVINFRADFIRFLKEKGHEVSVIAHDDERKSDVLNLGVSAFYCAKQDNRSLNPFSILTYKKTLKEIISKEKPDYLFTYQLKPNVFGTIAGKKAGVKNIYSFVEGLGDVYVNNSFKWKIIRLVVNSLYKRAFRHAKAVCFLNEEDKMEFVNRKLVKQEKCHVFHLVGLDLNHFKYCDVKNNARFLMVARMLKTKGLFEYFECARIVKEKYPNAIFDYVGAEGSQKISDVQDYVDKGIVNYHGVQKDVRPFYENATVNVLPSYREGLGLVNAEAGAIGRMSITCNVVGTKDTVKDGYNGFLIEKENVNQLVEKVIWCIENPEEVAKMGKNARTFVEQHFERSKINERVYKTIIDCDR